MKRTIQYQTFDGKMFADRRAAAAHEVDSTRIKRIADFFAKHVNSKPTDSALLETAAKQIVEHAVEFAELISARATRRHLLRAGSSSSVAVGRRPRGQQATKVVNS
jgi:hypothetical protein